MPFEYKVYENYRRCLDNWTVLLCYGQDPAFRFVKVPICSIIMAPNYSRTRHNVQSPYFIIAVVEVDNSSHCRHCPCVISELHRLSMLNRCSLEQLVWTRYD
ncbi:hypothetical protein LB507_001399 [Fusarium sp. FIESC RH6]|nr:hypothetical protein LB507_001399 [Fusarium sp. FIESC RH6]